MAGQDRAHTNKGGDLDREYRKDPGKGTVQKFRKGWETVLGEDIYEMVFGREAYNHLVGGVMGRQDRVWGEIYDV